MDEIIQARFQDLAFALEWLEHEVYRYHYDRGEVSHVYNYDLWFKTLDQIQRILLQGEMPRDDGEAGN